MAPGGMSSLRDVRAAQGSLGDNMESFVFAETFKVGLQLLPRIAWNPGIAADRFDIFAVLLSPTIRSGIDLVGRLRLHYGSASFLASQSTTWKIQLLDAFTISSRRSER